MTHEETVLRALDADLAQSHAQLVDETGLEGIQVTNTLNRLKNSGKAKRGPEGWLLTAAPPPLAAEKSPSEKCGTAAPKANGGNGHELPAFAKVQPHAAISQPSTPGIDYAAVFADLMAKRDKLDAAIAAIGELAGV